VAVAVVHLLSEVTPPQILVALVEQELQVALLAQALLEAVAVVVVEIQAV
jgi:hypothetical protein